MRIKRAQTFIEYVLVISVITAVMLAMSTLLRRSVQGMVKVVADQIGNQQCAEQENDPEASIIEDMDIASQSDRRTNTREYEGNATYTYSDETRTQTFMRIKSGG